MGPEEILKKLKQGIIGDPNPRPPTVGDLKGAWYRLTNPSLNDPLSLVAQGAGLKGAGALPGLLKAAAMAGIAGNTAKGVIGGGSSGGGGGTASTPGTTSGYSGGLFSGVSSQIQSAAQAMAGNGSNGQISMEDLLAMISASEGSSGGSGGRVDTPVDWYSAETDRMMTDAKIADMMYQRTVQEAQLALQRGDIQLAREKFEDSKIWSARSADAQDESNRLTGVGRQIDAYSNIGDLQLGAMGVQNQSYGKAGDITNDATGLQLSGLNDAGNLELSGYGMQGNLLGDAGTLGIKNFSAVEDAILGRGNLAARGAENYSNLTGILGNLGAAQSELALKIATTPRNAIAGFLIGRGQNGGAASMFNPSNILGIDTATIQSVISQALQAAGQVGQLPNMQQFDVNSIIQGMVGAANNAASSASSNAAGIRGAANAAPGRVAGDTAALRAVGAGAPGAIQGAVTGLGNAAASVANKAPATIPGAPTSMAPYQATLNQMIAAGAPQDAINMYRNNITSAGYGA